MSSYKNFYNIQNPENYKNNIKHNIDTILTKYINVIYEYFKYLDDNNIYNISENQQYMKYIIINGLNTINSIFKLLLLYTNNLELVVYHSQKSYIYYVEFISQIESDTNNFLQLNSKDASLFVYKKTIFEINNEIKKDFSVKKENNILLLKVNKYIDLTSKILDQNINNYYLNNDNKIMNNKIISILQKVIELIFNDNSNFNKKYDLIFNLNTKDSYNNYIENIETILKKNKKKGIN